MKIFGAMVIVFVNAVLATASAAGFSENFEHGLPAAWKSHKFGALTTYEVVAEGTNHVLKATAKSAASGIGLEIAEPVKPGTQLRWKWKIDKLPAGASEKDIKKFDHVVRVYVAFKTFGIPRTLNYVWSDEKVGTTFDHPSTSHGKFLVLESGTGKAGQWVSESRDLYADWKKFFGNSEPPAIASIGLMTDSDGTGTDLIGYYDDLQLVVK